MTPILEIALRVSVPLKKPSTAAERISSRIKFQSKNQAATFMEKRFPGGPMPNADSMKIR
jgi:hypothetical protein